MLSEMCDKHPSARAMVRADFDSGGSLFFCGNCHRTFFGRGEVAGITFTYATATV